MQIIKNFKELTTLKAEQKRHFVPTMGALHSGHLSLIEKARQMAQPDDEVCVSIFVNPIQFNQADDYENYPNTLEADLKACRDAGVDCVFLPQASEFYPQNFSINVTETLLGKNLCGSTRPGHFDGVCTVLLKFFNLLKPSAAYFGEKDFQQLAIVKKMVLDLNLNQNLEIIGVPTFREDDGLACSSRNLRLSSDQRATAPKLYKTLTEIKNLLLTGKNWKSTHSTSKEKLERAGFTVDYLELVESATLQPTNSVEKPCLCAVAASLGDVRLIDNIIIQHG